MVTEKVIEDVLSKKRPTVKELRECLIDIHSELQKKEEVIEELKKSNKVYIDSDSSLRTRIFNMNSEITLLRNRNCTLADKLSAINSTKNIVIRTLILVWAILASIISIIVVI